MYFLVISYIGLCAVLCSSVEKRFIYITFVACIPFPVLLILTFSLCVIFPFFNVSKNNKRNETKLECSFPPACENPAGLCFLRSNNAIQS